MKKNKFFEKAVTTVTALVALVFSLNVFIACTPDEVVTINNEKPKPNPGPDPVNPEWYVNDVFQVSCEATNFDWKSTLGVELTTRSSAYEGIELEENAQLNITHKYTADIEYKDKNDADAEKHEQDSKTYTSSLFAETGGLKKPMVFSNVNEMTKATLALEKTATDGKFFRLSWGGSKFIPVKTSASLSQESLTFEGKTVTDLCSSEFDTPVFISAVPTETNSDKSGYNKYRILVTLKLTALNVGNSNNVRYMKFYIENAYTKKQGENPDPIDPVDPELFGYDVKDTNFSNGSTSGTIIEIYDDFSEKEIGKFSIRLNNSTVAPQDVTLTVSDLSWSEGEATATKLAATGESRSENVAGGCKVDIQEVYTALTTRSKAAMTFKGIYEIPTIQFPDGSSKKLAYGEYELTNKNIEETNVSETSKTLVHKVNATFNGGKTENLSANVILNKNGENPNPGENKETGLVIENFETKDRYYIMDVVHYWSNSDPTRENISIPHSAVQRAEDEKLTVSRNYNTTTPSMVLKNSESYQTTINKLRVDGTIGTYESKFIFAGADVIVTSTYLNTFTITSEAGNTATQEIKTKAYKTGSTLGTQDFGDASKHVYKDNVNFALPVQGADIASCTQVLRFEEKIDTPIDPEPEDPITDIFASIKSNTIDFVNGYWTATMKAAIKNSKGVERDTTMQRVYLEAGVSYDAIADFISPENDFGLPNVSNDGSASTYSKGDITYSKQPKKAVADKFNQKIIVINGSSSVTVAGQKLDFLSTEIDVNPTGKNQVQSPTAQGKYNVWASEVSYRHGFGSHFDNSTTNFNIKVEKPKEYIDLSFKPIAAAVSLAFNDDHSQSGAYIVCTILGEGGKARLYTSPYNKNGNMTIGTNYKDFSDVRSCPHIPSATHDNQGNLIPASLEVVDKDWVYTPIHSEGTPNMVSSAENLIDGRKSPLISKGSVENGILTITINGQEYYFRGTN